MHCTAWSNLDETVLQFGLNFGIGLNKDNTKITNLLNKCNLIMNELTTGA